MDLSDLVRTGRSLSREPLVHFALVGVLLFGTDALLRGDRSAEAIVISEPFIRGLEAQWKRRVGAPPTKKQLQERIDAYVDSEVLYREALALGLGRGDPIIRRRLVQKMRFVAEEAEAREPTDAQLAAYLRRHRDRFVLPTRYDLHQLFFSRQRRGARALADAHRVLARLRRERSGRDARRIAHPDPSLLPAQLEGASLTRLERRFGSRLARAVREAAPDRWVGPVTSSYGAHLLRVSARHPGRLPRVAEIRRSLSLGWRAEQRQRAARQRIARWRARYRIVLPESLARDTAPGEVASR